MYEPQVRGAMMTDQQRSQFVQKARLDRLAYEAAQFLSLGETGKAATLIGGASTPATKQQLATWVHHYATTRFKIATHTVDDFLSGITAADVAL